MAAHLGEELRVERGDALVVNVLQDPIQHLLIDELLVGLGHRPVLALEHRA